MIDTPQIVQTHEQPTAVIRITTPRATIREVMGPGYSELTSTLGAQGVVPVGPWFNHHLKMTPDFFDFELGVPVDAPVTAAGRVVASHLPAVTAARTIYHGPYEGLPVAWGQFGDWIAAQGLTPGPSLWEAYLTGPAASPDPALWRTELVRPLLDPKP